MLFFSGGTALRQTASLLANYISSCAYVITTLDSGGSSAPLRKAFGIPAVGDIRSRLLSLATPQVPGMAELCQLLAYRLAGNPKNLLQKEWAELLAATHPLCLPVSKKALRAVIDRLMLFEQTRPRAFPFMGACIGNLYIAGACIAHNYSLAPAVEEFASLVHARGFVYPVLETPAHLAVRLASGKVIIGQHRFTGKESKGITSPIQAIWLTPTDQSPIAITPAITPQLSAIIAGAKAICYPIGSFYSSLVANFLPAGVGRAVALCKGSKVFVPNLGDDPELFGHTLHDQITALLRPLQADAPNAKPNELLSCVLVDPNKEYSGGIPKAWLQDHGIALRFVPLVSVQSAPLADPTLLAEGLLPFLGL